MKQAIWRVGFSLILATGVLAQTATAAPDRPFRTAVMGMAGQETSDTQTSESNGGRKVTTTTTTKDANGKVIRKETRVDEYDKPKGSPDRKNTKTTTEVEEFEKGKSVKKTTTIKTYDDEGGSTTTVSETEGGKTVTKEVTDRDPMGQIKKETDYEDGKPLRTKEYDPPGGEHPKKVTELDEKGRPKKVTELDGKGRPVKVTDYDKGKPVKETEYEDGKPTRETELDEKGRKKLVFELDEKGKVKRVTSYYPDGKKKEETEVKDDKPIKTTKWDKEGKQTSEETFALPSPFFAVAPSRLVAGAGFAVTIARLDGQVVANQPVVLDGGPQGKLTLTTDLNGTVVGKTPDNWRTARLVVGGVLAAMVVDSVLRPARPWPKQVSSGSVATVPLPVGVSNPGELRITVGGQPANVLAAAGNEAKIHIPAQVPTGPTTIEVEAPGVAPVQSPIVEIVRIQWAPGTNQMTIGQKSVRNLEVVGTASRIEIWITDPTGDAVRVLNPGRRTSSGGPRNTVPVELLASAIGPYEVGAVLANAVKTEYEQDLENAEVADKDAAGWDDSADAESNTSVQEAKRMAAGFARKAAAAWRKGADARLHGKDKEAEAWEEAAENWEEAASEMGANRNPGRANAAADEARMHEDRARRGGS